jgi:hypothetical protein
VYLAVNGLILMSAMFFERQRYSSRADRTQGGFQPTSEWFVDPTSQRLMEVFYNPAMGEREYREVTRVPCKKHPRHGQIRRGGAC